MGAKLIQARIAVAAALGCVVVFGWINYPAHRAVQKACDRYAKRDGFTVVGHAGGWRDRGELVVNLREVSSNTTSAGLTRCLHDVAVAVRSSDSLERVTLARAGEPRVQIDGQVFKTAGYGSVLLPWDFWDDIRLGAETPAGRRFELDNARNEAAAKDVWFIGGVIRWIDGLTQSTEIGDAILAEWTRPEQSQPGPASASQR